SFRFPSNSVASRDRQRGGGRNEEQRRNESTGEDRGGFADGSDSEHCKTPFLTLAGPDHRAHAIVNAWGVPNWKSRYFSVVEICRWRHLPAIAAAKWEKFPTRAAQMQEVVSENGHALHL